MRPSRRDYRRSLPQPRRTDHKTAVPLADGQFPKSVATSPVTDLGAQFPSPPLLRWLVAMGAFTVLASAMSLMMGAAWLSTHVLLNPDAVFWLNQYLPQQDLQPSPASNREIPQTLAEIQTTLRLSQRQGGQWIHLDAAGQAGETAFTSPDLLLPIWQVSPNCHFRCQTLIELRVYRPLRLPALLRQFQSRQYFRLIDQVTIAQPQEADVIVPLPNPKLANYGSTRRLPFTHIQRDSAVQGQQGVWLQISGQLPQESTAYGQIFYYSPAQRQLRLLLRWHSPTGTSPTWQTITAGQMPALVINQTQGLDLAYQIYQVRGAPDGFPQLKPITLSPAALPHPTYREGLRLAQAGLWSESLALLTSIQSPPRSSWSAAAQSQFVLVRFYAQISRQQSEQLVTSPAQSILAQLFDGRWHRGLEIWQTVAALEPELQPLLQAESRPLMRRVEATLNHRPGQGAALLWGTLITAAQAGESAAIAWLRQQPGQNETIMAQAKVWLRRLAAQPSIDTQRTTPTAPAITVPPASPLPQTLPTPETALSPSLLP